MNLHLVGCAGKCHVVYRETETYGFRTEVVADVFERVLVGPYIVVCSNHIIYLLSTIGGMTSV